MPNKNSVTFGLIGLGGLVVVAVGVFAVVNYLLRDTVASTGPITAVPLAVNTSAPPTTAPEPTSGGGEASPTEAPVAQFTATPKTSAPTIFQIVASQSQASFSIHEELNGQPKTVLGTTTEVAGQLAVNANDLSQTQVGAIQVGVRSLSTDSGRRNNAIRRFILQTDAFEFVTFTPTSVTGLSGGAQPGQTLTFQIHGDLTIRDVTKPATFDVTAQGVSATQISGTATTIVLRNDYGLQIPSVPNGANVGNEVTLQLDFVAASGG